MSNQNEKYERLKQSIANHEGQKGALMPVLQEAQSIFGCVPMDSVMLNGFVLLTFSS